MSTSTPSQGSLDRIETTPKSGHERFRDGSLDLGFDLRSFWSWCVSDLVSNATRGILAEYIVARALNAEPKHIRDEWAAHDLVTPDGVKVEVKSAAYLQSWKQQELSSIGFGIGKTQAWDARSGKFEPGSRRQADIYVFALLEHHDKSTVDPMDASQWSFYVVRTAELDSKLPNQERISLTPLKLLAKPPVKYSELRDAVSAEAREILGCRQA